MIELIKELVKRNWSFEYNEGTLYLILGNTERWVKSNEDAEKLLNEIKTYW
jgi:hypothetical protein